MKIAVVILNWNGKKLLEQFLPSIVAYSKAATVYVADNASTDNSVAFVKAHYPQIKIVENSENGGYAKGYNDALQHIDADVYALVNSDIEVTPNWLSPILLAFKKKPETAIIQPKILDYKNKEKFEYAGAGGGFIDRFGYPFCRGRLFDSLEIDNGQYNDTVPIFWASGACLFIKSTVFHNLGGFDTQFFAHQEEIDLCWRAFNQNYQCLHVGDSIVYHIGGATLKAQNPQKTFLNFRNSLFVLLKNLPKNKMFSTIFFRLLLDGIAGVKFLIALKPMHTIAIIKAHFSFYAHFSEMKAKRYNSQKSDYYKTKSIVWQYFIKGKKKFSELLDS